MRILLAVSFYICLSLAFAQSKHKNVTFRDEFISNVNNWVVEQKPNYVYKLEDGLYKMDIYDSLIKKSLKSFKETLESNFFIEFEVGKLEGKQIGFYLASADTENGYLFHLKPGKSIEFLKLTKGNETSLHSQNWNNIFNKVNDLKFHIIENKLTIWINDVKILENQSILPDGKKFGFSMYKSSLHLKSITIGNWTQEIDLVAGWDLFGDPKRLPDHINSEYIEIVPVISPNGQDLYFSRRDDPANLGTQMKDDIFHTFKTEDKTWSPATRLGYPLNNKDANYVCSIAENGKTLLLGNLYLPDSSCKLGVSISRWTNKGWGFPKELKIQNYYNLNKNQEFFLSADARILIMTLERKDTKGLKDLYVSFLKKDGTFSEPQNLGSNINSTQNEIGPFLSPDGNLLYFSSFGHPGYGSADIFVSEKLDDTYLNWSKPKNLGPKINSKGFDAYFSTTEDLSIAYMVKTNEHTRQDIYEVSLPVIPQNDPQIKIYGYVRNQKNNEGISASLCFSWENHTLNLTSDKNGYFETMVPRGCEVTITCESEGFYKSEELFSTLPFIHMREKRKDLTLSPLEIGSIVVLNNVLFAQGTSKIMDESVASVEYLANFMLKNPKLEIEIRGHTEKMGDENLNIWLSENRAMEIKKMLIANGINEKRLTTKGFGSSNPIAPNDSEQNRRKNRRVEFVILKK